MTYIEFWPARGTTPPGEWPVIWPEAYHVPRVGEIWVHGEQWFIIDVVMWSAPHRVDIQVRQTDSDLWIETGV